MGGVLGLVGLGIVSGSQKTTPRVGLSRAGLEQNTKCWVNKILMPTLSSSAAFR